MKASQGSCRDGAGPLWAQRAREATAWHPLHALCALTGAPRSSCVLDRIPSVFWDGSHGSGARSQGCTVVGSVPPEPLSPSPTSVGGQQLPVRCWGAPGATGSVPPRCRAAAAGSHKLDVSQGSTGNAQAGWSPWQRCPCPVGTGSCEWAAINRHNCRAEAAAPAAAAPWRK